MPRLGNGQYAAPLNSWNPAINGTQALPNDWMAILNDLAAGVQGSVAADGQTPITGVINHGGYRITGIGVPNGDGDALRFEQLGKGEDIASAATITIPNEGQLFGVTGTVAITKINDAYNGRFAFLTFSDVVTLTHSANLILPQGKNIVTAAGDVIGFMNIAVGVWVATTLPVSAATSSSKASGVEFTPVGNIIAINVQAALAELDTEKVAKAGDTMAGNLSIAKNVSAVELKSSNGNYNYKLLANVTNTTDFGFEVQRNGITIVKATNTSFQANGAEVWSNANFNPATKAPANATVTRTGTYLEFGGSVAPDLAITYDVPAPYVITGLRTVAGANSIYPRGTMLRNQ